MHSNTTVKGWKGYKYHSMIRDERYDVSTHKMEKPEFWIIYKRTMYINIIYIIKDWNIYIL